MFNWTSVLLLEDEPMLAQTLTIALKKAGISNIKHVTTLKDAEQYIQSKQPELFILDRMLPDGDGIEFCQRLRSDGYQEPILFLTARGETSDKVAGLNSGADDYLSKPFSWDELVARLSALHRRSLMHNRVQNQNPKKSIPKWTLDPQRLRILSQKGWVELTPLEYKMASHLILSNGNIVSREELLKEVWGFRFLPKTRTVDYFMGRIRKHFELNPDDPQCFLTVRGAGYRFDGEGLSDHGKQQSIKS